LGHLGGACGEVNGARRTGVALARLTVLVGRLLLEHGVDAPAAALAFHVQEMLAAAAADDQEGAARV
jgi:hypothetical protein